MTTYLFPHVKTKGLLATFGTFQGNFNGGPNHLPFWIIRENQQVNEPNYRIHLSLFSQGQRPCLLALPR
jgi:hypothetical protein